MRPKKASIALAEELLALGELRLETLQRTFVLARLGQLQAHLRGLLLPILLGLVNDHSLRRVLLIGHLYRRVFDVSFLNINICVVVLLGHLLLPVAAPRTDRRRE